MVKLIIGGSRQTEVLSKETSLLNIFLALPLDLVNILFRFLDLIIHQEVPKLFSQQDLRGLVDKTTAQQCQDEQFETDSRRREFSVNIP